MNVSGYFRRSLRPLILSGNQPAWLIKHPRRRYIEMMVLSTPPWQDPTALQAIHRFKRDISLQRGISYVTDHIIPLCHPMVCGLTVPWNLDIVTRAVNASKGNKFNPHQLEFLW